MASDHIFTAAWREDRLVLGGELDLAGVESFREALAGCDGAAVVVDLGALGFVDSVGLRTLLDARREHAHVRFVAPSRQLRRLAEIAGVAGHLFAE